MFPPLDLEDLGYPAPEEDQVSRDTKASEVIPVTVHALEEAPQVHVDYLDPQGATAAPDFLDERVSLVTVVHQASMAFRDQLVVLVAGVYLAVRERRGHLTTLTLVQGRKESSELLGPEDLRVKLENPAETDCLASLEPPDSQAMLALAQ